MPLAELPPERIFGEIEKLVAQGPPAVRSACRLMREWGMLPTLAPELAAPGRHAAEPEWHPEGDVWIHTLLAMDEAAQQIADLDRPRALAVMLGTLCHDLGKPAHHPLRGRPRALEGPRGGGLEPTRTLLDRWNVHTLLGYDLRGQVLALVGNHLKPYQLYKDASWSRTAPSAACPPSASRSCSTAWPAPTAWAARRPVLDRAHGLVPCAAPRSWTWPRARPSRS
jgi:tRNA nucleotidyltransferase (CCA-adding enzyme)